MLFSADRILTIREVQFGLCISQKSDILYSQQLNTIIYCCIWPFLMQYFKWHLRTLKLNFKNLFEGYFMILSVFIGFFSSFHEVLGFRWFYCVWTNELQTLRFQSLRVVQKWEDWWLCMCTNLLQRHTVSCLPRIKVTTESHVVMKSDLVRHLVLACFSMSSKPGKVQAEIRFYVAMLENLNRWTLPRGWWHVKGPSHIFHMCSSPSVQAWPSKGLTCWTLWEGSLLGYRFPCKMPPWQVGQLLLDPWCCFPCLHSLFSAPFFGDAFWI